MPAKRRGEADARALLRKFGRALDSDDSPTRVRRPGGSGLAAVRSAVATTPSATAPTSWVAAWGLVTHLDEDLRLTLIEHVAHLVAREYAEIPGDLVKLDFVPEGGEAAAEDAGVVDLLTRAYSKRAEGGGFANFDVVPRRLSFFSFRRGAS